MLISIPTVTEKGHWHLPERGMDPPTIFKEPPKALFSNRYFRGIKTIDSLEAEMESFKRSNRIRDAISTVPRNTNVGVGINYTNYGNPGFQVSSSSSMSGKGIPKFEAGNPYKAFRNNYFRTELEAPITLDRALNHVPRRDIIAETNLYHPLGAYPKADPAAVSHIKETEVTSSLLPSMVYNLSIPFDSVVAWREKDIPVTAAESIPANFDKDIHLLDQLESIPEGRLIRDSTPIAFSTSPYTREAVTVDILDMKDSAVYRERKDEGIQKFLRSNFETRVYHPETETFVPVKTSKGDRENIAATVNANGPLKFNTLDGIPMKLRDYTWKVYQPRIGKPILILETEDPSVMKLKDEILIPVTSGISGIKRTRDDTSVPFHDKWLPTVATSAGVRGTEKFMTTDTTPGFRAKAVFDAALYTRPTPIPRFEMEPTPEYRESKVPSNIEVRADYFAPRLEEHGMSSSIRTKGAYVDMGKLMGEEMTTRSLENRGAFSGWTMS